MGKVCKVCGIDKPLEMFYIHSGMKDGRLNKCIDCTKLRVSDRYRRLSKSDEFVEKERQRGREKYKRLNYKDKYSYYKTEKEWVNSVVIKNLHRNNKIEKGLECHHWSYNDEHLNSFFVLSKKYHKMAHKHILLDMDHKMFRAKDGVLLDSVQKHKDYLIGKGVNILAIPF